jgi:hypothetical protein
VFGKNYGMLAQLFWGAEFTSKSESAGAPQFANFDLLPTVFFPEQTAICAHNLHGNASQAACAGPPDSR